MRRVDCFKFCHELDLLELRLLTLEDVVDWFVLVEATVTHSGKPKPLYYELNRKRYKRWADKIRHVVVEDIPGPPASSFDRDRFQMNAAVRGLPPLQSSDMVIVGDLDEIPNPDVIRAYRPEMGVVGLHSYNGIFFLNIENYQVPWFQPKLAPFGIVQKTTLVGLRDYNAEKWGHYIQNGGWHFSYCAGTTSLGYKIDAFAHAGEINGKWRDQAIVKWVLQDPVNRTHFLCKTPIRYRKVDRTFPVYVQQHWMEFQSKGLIWNP